MKSWQVWQQYEQDPSQVTTADWDRFLREVKLIQAAALARFHTCWPTWRGEYQSIRPCCVLIGEEQIPGIMSELISRYTGNCEAIIKGDRLPGDVYIERRVYCFGLLPEVMYTDKHHRQRTIFVMKKQDWYVAAHSLEAERSSRSTTDAASPFFILAPWPFFDCNIRDDGERYYTYPMRIEAARCIEPPTAKPRYYKVLECNANIDYTGHILEYAGPGRVVGTVILWQPNRKGTLSIDITKLEAVGLPGENI